MPAVYSVRFAEDVNKTAGTYVVYTCPSGVVSVLRDLTLYCSSAGSGHAYILGPAGAVWAFLISPGQFSVLHESCRKVLTVGEELTFGVIDGQWDYSLSGYQLGI